MQHGLKYLKLFENTESTDLKSRFLTTFPSLTEVYWRMPEVAFAVWKHLAHDTGSIGKLIQLDLFDESNITNEMVKALPDIDKIVCIYGYKTEEIVTGKAVNLLNQMCNSIVVGVPSSAGGYRMYLDEDHLIDLEYLETVSLAPGGENALTKCKTLSDVPLMIVERMRRMIFLNVDDLDKMKPWS